MDPLQPSPSLLSKLGSITVHAEEMIDPVKGHHFDVTALKAVLNDPEVREWLKVMTEMAMVPVKR
jgi:hypothetical protein